MPFLTLIDHNVLYMVVGYITQGDAANLALACHAVYDVAMSRFLSEANLHRSSTQEVSHARIRQFCAFMLAEPGRIRHLRVFCAMRGWIEPEYATGRGASSATGEPSVASLVAQVLERAVGLRLLFLIGIEVNRALVLEPRLADALAALPNLQEIQWVYPDVNVLRCIGRMVCRPRRLVLSSWNELVRGEGQQADLLRDPTLLASVASFVQDLNVRDDPGPMGRIVSNIVWPNVRRLAIRSSLELARLPSAFPNAQEVDVYCTYAVVPQATVRADSLPSWSRLDYLKTSTPLPTPCPTRRLEMTRIDPRISSLSRCIHFIRQSAPVVLTIHFDLFDCQHFQELASAFSSVRVLGVQLVAVNNTPATRIIDNIVQYLLPPLGDLRLVALFFKVADQSPISISEAEDLAQTVAEKIPSLTSVGIPCYELDQSRLADPGDMSREIEKTIYWFQVLPRDVGGCEHSVVFKRCTFEEGKRLQVDILDRTR